MIDSSCSTQSSTAWMPSPCQVKIEDETAFCFSVGALEQAPALPSICGECWCVQSPAKDKTLRRSLWWGLASGAFPPAVRLFVCVNDLVPSFVCMFVFLSEAWVILLFSSSILSVWSTSGFFQFVFSFGNHYLYSVFFQFMWADFMDSLTNTSVIHPVFFHECASNIK